MSSPQPINPHAQSYAGAAAAYERGRPEYPPAAVALVVERLGLASSSSAHAAGVATVLDLAAGTGKFTRLLLPTGARIIAVEPVAAMCDRIAVQWPAVTVLEGTAEAIPLPDGSVDAVTVAQAFHWFRGREALAEIRRVLKPAGGLALIWNVRNESVDWVRRLSELMDPHNGGAPRYHTGAWREAFAVPNGFTPLAVERIPFVHLGTPEQVVDRAASTSFVAGLPPATRAGLLDEVRRMLREHPLTGGRETIPFPYVTEVYCCRKA
jgi:SAM-dependent methyltransferase